MAQQDVYVNVDRPSRNPGKKKSFGKSLENIYENGDALESKRTGPAGAADRKRVKKGSCRGAAVCLGLLCLLLLTGFITLLLLYTTGNSEWVKLQTSYKNLSEERDWWQRRFEDMAKDRNAVQTNLPTGGVKYGTSHYYVSTEKKTWKESREACQSKGADLVIINSEEEQKFIIEFNKIIWIGLTDQDEEGVWKWVDGTTLSTKYWYSPQPDNGGTLGYAEDCAEMYVESHDPLLKWNDAHCSQRNYWVCETSSN
ncbi:CD209 antigen-like protein E [Plectropomus leopardus]|uniref:CD209 antigen-like protein E n=1 Tax=Plectropomus leopardus TaxID=160734 RepID=UPI001C4DA0C1|nr:CD209 antigen-like protein E [Plectropomus leopardus]